MNMMYSYSSLAARSSAAPIQFSFGVSVGVAWAEAGSVRTNSGVYVVARKGA